MMARRIAPFEFGSVPIASGWAHSSDPKEITINTKRIDYFGTSVDSPTTDSAAINVLSSDLLLHVFSFLDGQSAFAAQRVSKTWHAASSSPSANRLWRSLFLHEVSPWIQALPLRLGFFANPKSYPQSYALFGNKQLAPNLWPASESAFDMVREYLGYSQCNRERGRRLAEILLDYEANIIQGVAQKFLSAVGAASNSDAALVTRLIFLMTRTLFGKAGVVVLEVDDLGESGVDVVFRLVKELVKVVENHRVVFYSDHNDRRPTTFSRAHRQRWTWNTVTGSRFKCSRRKVAITPNIPVIAICCDPQAFVSTPWLPFRCTNLFFVHERRRKGPLPQWLQCLTNITIVSSLKL